MEHKGSFPHSQVPANCPYPEPAKSSPYPTFHCLKTYLNIVLLSTNRSSKWLFPSGFTTKTLYARLLSPIRVTCPTHLILLDFITRKICAEEYRSLSSSLCSFLHSPLSLSILGPNILLNALFSNTFSLFL